MDLGLAYTNTTSRRHSRMKRIWPEPCSTGHTHVWQVRTYGMDYLQDNKGMVERPTHAANAAFWEAATMNR